ncbi:glycosyltransferase family 39 protein [Streptomyces sp. NEAU-YJ-81]|uniref:glycosyltransferase family 39 protein n=1 Tax=Streptomyces sp. NEAU-YJ-81 TaxID=2820288 RepID=UPI001ABD471F|nr:glycosyltransferase family 39 protein [Streptomyces sp. NEAU-YJ-81]MBO3678232.1 glycosyltransferase family 39 protein [Streptomyces sp. NEAU-YJ-81]
MAISPALDTARGVPRVHPAPPVRSRPGPAVVALAPAGLALALGLWGIRRENSMWRDESTTYQVAHRSLGEIGHLLGNADVAHGLYYLLMHAVFALWDGGLLALRLPSVLAMAATAAGVGLLGHRLAGPRAGLVAGLVFPLAPAVQRYAPEGRSYALVSAAVVAATHLLLSAVARPRKRTWAGYAAVASLACLLHEFAILAVAAHGVTLYRARVGARSGWAWGQAASAVAVVLAPLVIVSQQQAALVGWISAPGPPELLGFGALALTGLVCARGPLPARGSVPLRDLALALLILPPAALMAVSYLHPLYVDRYVLYAHVGLALLIGARLDALSRTVAAPRALAGGLAVVAVAALLPYSLQLRTPGSRLDNTLAAARAVRELGRPGDGVLFLPARRREPIMSSPEDFRGLRELALARHAIPSGTLHGIELPAPRIRARMLMAGRIVTVNDPPGQPLDDTPQERVKREVLAEHFHRCAVRDVTGMRIVLYGRAGRC